MTVIYHGSPHAENMTQKSFYYGKTQLPLFLTKKLPHLANKHDETWTIQPLPAKVPVIDYNVHFPTIILFKFCGFCSMSGFPHFHAILVSTGVLNHHDMKPQGNSSKRLKLHRAKRDYLGFLFLEVCSSCSLYRRVMGRMLLNVAEWDKTHL